MAQIDLKKTLRGRILDIGGGGEGVIGRLYQSQVTAIDNCPQELEEAPEGFEKLLMEAEKLAFPEESFDHVTFFYSLMYMAAQTRRRAIEEAVRVLRRGGGLHIWDTRIESGKSEFLAELDIRLPGQTLHADYGLRGDIDGQDDEALVALCTDAGLRLADRSRRESQFYLSFLK